MPKLRVGLMFGGKSGEHEISLLSAAALIRHMDRSRYEVVPIAITKTGRLATGQELRRMLPEDCLSLLRLPRSKNPVQVLGEPATQTLVTFRPGGSRAEALDVIFPVLHGPYGEDGTIQGLLELADLPYVGSGVAASSLGMDKELMKKVFRNAGLPVVDFRTILRKDWEGRREEVARELVAQFPFPCFVKPANLGSSVGVTKVHGKTELEAAMDKAALYDRKIIVEEGLEVREIECSVLGNDDPVASVPGEVVPAREFYDYEAKYVDKGSRLLIPAPLDPDAADRVRELAVRAFRALDCAGFARVDFFVEKVNGDIYVNEINTIPGFTAISMFPKLWEASGLPFSRLIDRLIELALERYRDRKRNRV
ncbi:MAG: D-alanine--D-alanine ligase [Acidobacteria bacterium]|nr:D-alanine--D-alanine ligase [Acidobacteriota bacterium]